MKAKSDHRNKMRVFLLSFMLVTLLFAMIPVPSAAQGDQGRPIYGYVEVDIKNGTEPYAAADVGPGYSGIVHFTGVVDVQRYGPIRGYNIIVELDAIFDEPTDTWGASISPPIIFLGPNERSAIFKINIRAPPLVTETGSSKDMKVSVGGVWYTNPGFAGGIIGYDTHVTVGVNQYYDLIVNSPDVMVKIWPGYSTAHFGVLIKNNGNGEDTFRIEIENLNSLTAAGFAFNTKSWEITIPEKEYATFNITVEPPKDTVPSWKRQLTQIPIRVVSKNSEYNVKETPVKWRQFNLFLYEKGVYFSGISIVAIILIVAMIYAMIWRSRKRRGIKRRKKKKRSQN